MNSNPVAFCSQLIPIKSAAAQNQQTKPVALLFLPLSLFERALRGCVNLTPGIPHAHSHETCDQRCTILSIIIIEACSRCYAAAMPISKVIDPHITKHSRAPHSREIVRITTRSGSQPGRTAAAAAAAAAAGLSPPMSLW